MANVIKKLSLSRRTFLRGSSAAIALPWLDAMVPALGRAPKGPIRSVFVFAPNGQKMDDWTPKDEGRTWSMTALLKPLESLRAHFDVLSSLAIDAGRPHGDGPGDHARAASTYLTCMHPRKTGGADIHVGVSIDQVIAAHVGKHTRFPSLELGTEGGRKGGVCDSGYSCAYSNNISWRAPSAPVAKETRPRAVFGRLFGTSSSDPSSFDPKAEERRRRQAQSVLDSAWADAKRLRGKLGGSDRAKLDDYLASIREVEQRTRKLREETHSADIPRDFFDHGDGSRFKDRLRLFYDLIALALQTDSTRTVTFMLGRAGSSRSYRFLGVPEGHHYLSHHGGNPAKLAKIKKINRFHVEQFARFLTRLAKIEDGDSNLLHRSMIVYGSGIGDGNRHDHMDVPVLLAGHANGRIATGKHVRYARHTPMANLYLRMLEALDIETGKFADSTGPLAI